MSQQNLPADPNNRPAQDAAPACPYCLRHFTSMDEMTLHIVTRHTRAGKISETILPNKTRTNLFRILR